MSALARAASQSKPAAFAEPVRRRQAVAIAHAVLRDLRLAGDAFVAADRGLGQLGSPSTFLGWVRTVVRADGLGAAAPSDRARTHRGAPPERTPCPWLDRSSVGSARQPTLADGPVEAGTPC